MRGPNSVRQGVGIFGSKTQYILAIISPEGANREGESHNLRGQHPRRRRMSGTFAIELLRGAVVHMLMPCTSHPKDLEVGQVRYRAVIPSAVQREDQREPGCFLGFFDVCPVLDGRSPLSGSEWRTARLAAPIELLPHRFPRLQRQEPNFILRSASVKRR